LAELRRTQTWLAEQLGTKQKYVSDYVTGKTIPKRNMLVKLLEILDVPYDTLYGLTQRWLAKKMGITEEAVSKYTNGKDIPKRIFLERFFKTLDVPYKTLDEFLADNPF